MENVEQEQGYGKLEWLFYIILLPLLFTAILTGVLLSFLGYDVTTSLQKTANEMPLIGKIVPAPEIAVQLEGKGSANLPQAEQLQQLKEQLEQKNTSLLKLEADMQLKNNEIKKLMEEIELLTKQNSNAALTEAEHSQKLKELSNLYSSMSPSKSAPILENLSVEEAVLVLSEMQLDKRGKILEKMDPKNAADISILLKDVIPTKDREIAALQERISLLNKALSDQQKKGVSNDDMAIAYSSMPPKKAAEVLVELYKNSPSQSILILSSMDQQAMSLIISEMPTSTASMITSKILQANEGS